MYLKSLFLLCVCAAAQTAAEATPKDISRVEVVLVAETSVLADVDQHLEDVFVAFDRLNTTLVTHGISLHTSAYAAGNIQYDNCFSSPQVLATNKQRPLPWDASSAYIPALIPTGLAGEPATARALPYLAYNAFSSEIATTRRVIVALVGAPPVWGEEVSLGFNFDCRKASAPAPEAFFAALKSQRASLLLVRTGEAATDSAENLTWSQLALTHNYADFVDVVVPETDSTDSTDVADKSGVAEGTHPDLAKSLVAAAVQKLNESEEQIPDESSAIAKAAYAMLVQPAKQQSGWVSMVPPAPVSVSCAPEAASHEHIIVVDATSKQLTRTMQLARTYADALARKAEEIQKVGGEASAAVYYVREKNDAQMWCFTRARKITAAVDSLLTDGSLADSAVTAEPYTPRGLGNAVLAEAFHWSMRSFNLLTEDASHRRFFTLFTYAAPVVGVQPYTYAGFSFPCSETEAPTPSIDEALRDFDTLQVHTLVVVADDENNAVRQQETAAKWQSLLASRLRSERVLVAQKNLDDNAEDATTLAKAYQQLLCVAN